MTLCRSFTPARALLRGLDTALDKGKGTTMVFFAQLHAYFQHRHQIGQLYVYPKLIIYVFY